MPLRVEGQSCHGCGQRRVTWWIPAPPFRLCGDCITLQAGYEQFRGDTDAV